MDTPQSPVTESETRSTSDPSNADTLSTSQESTSGHRNASPTDIPLSPVAPDVDINSRDNVILDVECGLNKAVLYLNQLSSGSKGSCILFDNAWLTPNEFQYISGRETAKDWKRSIKHYGKSLKLLIAKGVMTSEPASCMCEGCVATDDSLPPDTSDPSHKANLENVPPEERTEENQPCSPEVDSQDKVLPEVTDSHVTGADSKVEGGGRVVLHNRPGLGADLSDLAAEVTKKTAKKRKSQSKTAEKAKKSPKRPQSVKANSAETAASEATSGDSNGGVDQSRVPTPLGAGALTPEVRLLPTDTAAPTLEGAFSVTGSPRALSPLPPPSPHSVSGTLVGTETPEGSDRGAESPEFVFDSSDTENETDKLSDDIKFQSRLTSDSCPNTPKPHSPPSSPDLYPDDNIHHLDNTTPTALPTQFCAPAATEIASSAREVSATLMTSKTEDGLLTASAQERAKDNVLEQLSPAACSPRQDSPAPDPHGKDSPHQQEEEEEAVCELSDSDDDPMLSPRKEARLTNIIAELKSYKKQLIQRIEEQKEPGDSDDELDTTDDTHPSPSPSPSPSTSPSPSPSPSPSDVEDRQATDTPQDNKWPVVDGCPPAESKPAEPVEQPSDLKTAESEVPLEPSQTCRTLFHILSSGTTQDLRGKATKMEPVVASEGSEASETIEGQQRLPDSQPLKSTFEKSKAARDRRQEGKRSPKEAAPSPGDRDQSARKDANSSASSGSSSNPSRVAHSVTSLISQPTTVTSAVSPLSAASGMYMAPPLFHFPYAIPPPYMYPASMYSGYPFPQDPAALYKSPASTTSMSTPTTASLSHGLTSSHHKVSRSSPASTRHSSSPSVKYDSKSSSSKSYKRDHSPHRSHSNNNNNSNATNNNSSSSKHHKSLSNTNMLSPNLIAGHYLPMFSPFGLPPDMAHLASATSAAVPSSSTVSPRSSVPDRSQGSLNSSVNGKSREKRDKYYEYDNTGALDLSVKKRSAPASFEHLHHHHHAKRPCFDMGFTYRNGVVLDLSRSAR